MNSHHGNSRKQQRGFPQLLVDWLIAYGVERHDGRGGIIRHFTREARRRLERDIGREPVRRMHEWLDAGLVEFTDNRGHYRRLPVAECPRRMAA